MKSLVVCIVFVALVGGVLSGKQRRQAPPGVIPDGAADGVADGPPEGITTQKPTQGDILNGVIATKLADLDAKAALGITPSPKDVEKILTLSMVVGIVGGELSPDNQAAIDKLLTATPDDATA